MARLASIPRFLHLPEEGAGRAVARHLIEAPEERPPRRPPAGADRWVIAAMDGVRVAREVLGRARRWAGRRGGAG